jgi:hypothetical protein
MKYAITAICALTILAGCQVAPPQPAKTSLEIQAIQSKNFEAPVALSFKAVVSVLQDLGYSIQTADLNTGVITANSATKQDSSGGAFFLAMVDGTRSEEKTRVTASIEEFGTNSTRIRLNFVDFKFRSGARGQVATDETPVTNPAIYENAFEKIGEAIFIRQSQK